MRAGCRGAHSGGFVLDSTDAGRAHDPRRAGRLDPGLQVGGDGRTAWPTRPLRAGCGWAKWLLGLPARRRRTRGTGGRRRAGAERRNSGTRRAACSWLSRQQRGAVRRPVARPDCGRARRGASASLAGSDPSEALPALSASLKGLANASANPLAGIKGAAQRLARRSDADARSSPH